MLVCSLHGVVCAWWTLLNTLKACCHEHGNAFLSRLELCVIWLIFSLKISKCPKKCTVGKKLQKSMGSPGTFVTMNCINVFAGRYLGRTFSLLFEWNKWRLSCKKDIPVYHSLGHFSFFPGLSQFLANWLVLAWKHYSVFVDLRKQMYARKLTFPRGIFWISFVKLKIKETFCCPQLTWSYKQVIYATES